MDSSRTDAEEETMFLSSSEDEMDEEQIEQKENGDLEAAELQERQRRKWAPLFYYKPGKEVHTYVEQEIVIDEGLDSYAGNIWPGALALCNYLDTHREQLDLVGKAVLEIGAGTGLLSVVASLLGSWVTATDLPDALSNLRFNLSKNTRGRCQYTPQVAALEWGFDLEQTYPKSVYRYDYVLAAEVVYHHNFGDELLATMEHFCRPGTTLIWANKIRTDSDLRFLEKFQKTFNVCSLSDDGTTKILKATCKEEEMLEEEQMDKEVEEEVGQEEEQVEKEVENEPEKLMEEKQNEADLEEDSEQGDEESEAEESDDEETLEKEQEQGDEESEAEETLEKEQEQGDEESEAEETLEKEQEQGDEESEAEETLEKKQEQGDEESEAEESDDEETKEKEQEQGDKESEAEESDDEETKEKEQEQGDKESEAEESDDEETKEKEQENNTESDTKRDSMSNVLPPGQTPPWVPVYNSVFGKDVYHYIGQDIVIRETIDSYGAVMWPGALALCSFLDNNRDLVDLRDKEVLELGAGTGLVSIVASLLGASVTATDLPEIMGNLKANIMRNTRDTCRHKPKVEVLCWSLDLSESHPRSVYRYDYVLAADVVYHHDYPDELLATIKHFCRPGTTVLLANKLRMESDLTILEKFKKTFDTCLLVEDGDMKIFKATCRKQ